MYAHTQTTHDQILARHNEMAQDCNPDFVVHTIIRRNREVIVQFEYKHNNGDVQFNRFDDRKWS